MPRRRRVKLVRNPEHAGHLPYDEWIPAHAIKFNSDGTTTLMTEGHAHHNRGYPNVAGFQAGGTFHPIRWDPDYDPEETDEPGYATDWTAPGPHRGRGGRMIPGFFVGSRKKRKGPGARALDRKTAARMKILKKKTARRRR